jgi:hypothetical protein
MIHMKGILTRAPLPLMLALASIWLVVLPAYGQPYYLTDLGAVAPGLGINNSGQVSLQNYVYSGGTLTAYPTNFAAGGTNPTLSTGRGSGISSNGIIAGDYNADPNAGVATYNIATATVTEVPTNLGATDPTVQQSGMGINASGTVVGYWVSSNQAAQFAFAVTGGVVTVLSLSDLLSCSGDIGINYGAALAINDAGVITGYLPNAGTGLYGVPGFATCTSHIFTYFNGTYTDIAPGVGTAINASGAVTGYTFQTVYSSQNEQGLPVNLGAFLYSNGTLTLLPGNNANRNFADVGLGINKYNFIVGEGFSTAAAEIGFFWDGVVNDLNTFILPTDPLYNKVQLTDARGINDSGVVIVNGINLADSTKHAYLLQVPLLQVSGPLTFPSTALGSSSASQSVTFTNNSPATIVLGGASIPNGTVFSLQSNNCGAALAVGANCSITAIYTPIGAGTPSSALTLLVSGVPIAVPLSGSTPLTATISSSATSTTTGTPVTLTWSASTGATCTATGGSAADGWTGTIASSGSQKVSETLIGSSGSYTYGISCKAGTENESAQVTVTVSYPTVTVQISANPTSLLTGAATTITWSSANATSCTSTGGGSNDNWPSASRPSSGSASIIEPNPVITGKSETLTFTITCISSASGNHATASAQVIQNDAPSSSGGGGAFGFSSVLMLGGLLAARQLRSRVGC